MQFSFESDNHHHGENSFVTDFKISHWKLPWEHGSIAVSEVQLKMIWGGIRRVGGRHKREEIWGYMYMYS